MNTNVYAEKGFSRVKDIAGNAGILALQGLMEESPALGRIVVEFGFGDIYCQPGLDDKQREITSIVSLVGQGDTADQLRFHYRAALHTGLSEEEIGGILLHCVPYVGIPKVMNAMRIFQEVLHHREKESAGD
jgi:4-carboxymuconolactone decarboxylase